MLHWQIGASFPQPAKLTALRCRALTDALPAHLKQEHLRKDVMPKHALVDLRSFHPPISDLVTVSDHSPVDSRAFPRSVSLQHLAS
jgi:hypothetical protein